MKKIISLVLALVMVFAIAASASAITGQVWDKDESGYTGPYTITGFNLIKNPGVGAGLVYPDPASTDAAYIAGTAIYFAFYFTANKSEKIAMHADDYTAPWFAITATNGIVEWLPTYFNLYSISSTAVNSVTIASADAFDYYNSNKSIVTLDKLGTYAKPDDNGTASDLTDDKDVKYMILGSGVVKGSTSSSLVAEIMGNKSIKFFGAVTKASQFGSLFKEAKKEMTPGPKAIYDGTKKIYSVAMSSNEDQYTVTKHGTATATDYQLIFNVDPDKTKGGEETNLKGIKLVLGDGTTYNVMDTGAYVGGNNTSGLHFFPVTGGDAITSGDTFNDLAKKYNTIMDFFGFKFGQKGILLPIHFAAKFSDFYTKATDVKLNYSTTVPQPEGPELPPTGDAATSIGFVMIALAIVAASAVAYKKVRG